MPSNSTLDDTVDIFDRFNIGCHVWHPYPVGHGWHRFSSNKYCNSGTLQCNCGAIISAFGTISLHPIVNGDTVALQLGSDTV